MTLIDREVHPLKIIWEARLSKKTVKIAFAEMTFMLNQSSLTITDKCICAYLIMLSSDNPTLMISIDEESLADLLKIPVAIVKITIAKLEARGFLITIEKNESQRRYTLTYPLAGLLAIKKAPKIQHERSHETIVPSRNQSDHRRVSRHRSFNVVPTTAVISRSSLSSVFYTLWRRAVRWLKKFSRLI